MPILPGIGRVRGDYDAVFAVGFPYTVFSYAAFQTARAAGAPLILTPFLHLATPDDPYRKHYTRPHQIRLLAESDTVVVQTAIEADAVAEWGIPRSRILTLGMAVEHDEVTGGDPRALREPARDPAEPAGDRPPRDARPEQGVDRPGPGRRPPEPGRGRPTTRSTSSWPAPARPASSGSSPRCPAASPPAGSRCSGPLPLHERADFYAALDLFAMPSRTDSFGIVFLEAWANGLPVVAAAAGGVPEVVRHGETGLLVPFGDLDRLTGSLLALLSDPARARDDGRGRRRWSNAGTPGTTGSQPSSTAPVGSSPSVAGGSARRVDRRGPTHANAKTATTIAIRISAWGTTPSGIS